MEEEVEGVCTRVRCHERRSRCEVSGARAPGAPVLRRPRGCPVELPLGVSGPQWRTLAQSSSAMGSLPEGTMCCYCNQEEAGYIPDGLLGPTCGTCQDDAFQFGIDFIDRRRQTRFLHSLRAVTGGQAGQGRNHHFYHLFLDQHAELGYTLAPFLIWTSHCTRGGAAVAAQALLDEATEGSDDDNGFPPPLGGPMASGHAGRAGKRNHGGRGGRKE